MLDHEIMIRLKSSILFITWEFVYRVTEGEALQSVRTRMLERFKDISEKEFEKYKFSLITHGRMTPLNDGKHDFYHTHFKFYYNLNLILHFQQLSEDFKWSCSSWILVFSFQISRSTHRTLLQMSTKTRSQVSSHRIVPVLSNFEHFKFTDRSEK